MQIFQRTSAKVILFFDTAKTFVLKNFNQQKNTATTDSISTSYIYSHCYSLAKSINATIYDKIKINKNCTI